MREIIWRVARGFVLFPFLLTYLAVCLRHVLQRKTHEGQLCASKCVYAYLIIVHLFGCYLSLTADRCRTRYRGYGSAQRFSGEFERGVSVGVNKGGSVSKTKRKNDSTSPTRNFIHSSNPSQSAKSVHGKHSYWNWMNVLPHWAPKMAQPPITIDTDKVTWRQNSLHQYWSQRT